MLAALDLRYPNRFTPVIQYRGHVNTYSQHLGVALDPTQEFLFAAGQDRRIRGWSVRSGNPLFPPEVSEKEFSNPFLCEFSAVVEVLQVLPDHGGREVNSKSVRGMCLWAAAGKTLHQFYLGQR